MWFDDVSYRKMEQPISIRIAEAARRPLVYARSETSFQKALDWLVTMRAAATLPASASEDEQPRFTKEEVSTMEKILEEAQDFFKEKRKLQDAKKLWEDPVVKASELESKLRFLDSEVLRLDKKKAPRRRPRPTSKDSIEDMLSSLNISYTSFSGAPTDSGSSTAPEPTAGEVPTSTVLTDAVPEATEAAESTPERHDEL